MYLMNNTVIGSTVKLTPRSTGTGALSAVYGMARRNQGYTCQIQSEKGTEDLKLHESSFPPQTHKTEVSLYLHRKLSFKFSFRISFQYLTSRPFFCDFLALEVIITQYLNFCLNFVSSE